MLISTILLDGSQQNLVLLLVLLLQFWHFCLSRIIIFVFIYCIPKYFHSSGYHIIKFKLETLGLAIDLMVANQIMSCYSIKKVTKTKNYLEHLEFKRNILHEALKMSPNTKYQKSACLPIYSGDPNKGLVWYSNGEN